MRDTFLSALIFTLSLVGGIGIGVFMVSSSQEGGMMISERLSLVFTILGGGAGFIATILAFVIYCQWRKQKRNEIIYIAKVTLLKHIYSMNVYAGNMLVARANPSISKVNEHRINLIGVMSDVAVESDILKVLSSDLEELANKIMRLNDISAEIINLHLFPETDHIDKIYVASTHEWSNEFVKCFFDRVEYVSWEGLEGRCYKLDAVKDEINTLANSIKSSLKEEL